MTGAERFFYADCPPDAHGGSYSCDVCLAVVAWEGELPGSCLKCGAPLTERSAKERDVRHRLAYQVLTNEEREACEQIAKEALRHE